MEAWSGVFRDFAPTVELGGVGRAVVFFLLVLVPLLSLLQTRDSEIELPSRLPLYLSAALGIWLLAGLTALALRVEGVPLAQVGFHTASRASFVGWTSVATLGTLVASYVVTRVAARLGIRESRLTYHLMPKTGAERWAFLGVSASAGLCEEFAYHGFLLAALAAWLGSGWWAALVVNLAFGVLHAYQGQAGVLRAFLMGYLLSTPVIVGAGLWPAVTAHFLVNALLGLGLWKWIVPSAQSS